MLPSRRLAWQLSHLNGASPYYYEKKTFATVPKMLLCKTLNPYYLIIPTAK